MMKFGYQKDTDYAKLMQDAAASGDMARAAIYEAQRNEKIQGEGLTQHLQTNQYASYLPKTQTGYQNPYLDDLNAAIGRLQDGSAFKKAYLREADRTMRDTLGQYSTMTGGVPSAQAVAAASQAADYQKSKMAEAMADRDYQNANLLLSAGAQAQSEYQAMISQALSRWSQLGYADAQVSAILGVSQGTPTSDQSYVNWQRGQQDKGDAYTMAMTLLQAGQMPSADTLAAAGISAEDAQKLANANATPVYSYGGGGGGNPKEEPQTKEALSDKLWNELFAKYREGMESGDFSEFNSQMANYGRQYDMSEFDDFMAANVQGYESRYAPGENRTILSSLLGGVVGALTGETQNNVTANGTPWKAPTYEAIKKEVEHASDGTAIEDLLSRYWDYLTPAQRAELAVIYENRGL